MKKLFGIFVTALVCAVMMTGCILTESDSEVYVTVRNISGNTVAGEKVYMYNSTSDVASLNDPAKAKEVQETDADGDVRFVISKAEFLLEESKPFVFQTFAKDGNVNGRTILTVKRNSKTNTEINQY